MSAIRRRKLGPRDVDPVAGYQGHNTMNRGKGHPTRRPNLKRINKRTGRKPGRG